MSRILLLATFVLCSAIATFGSEMTYEVAKRNLPRRELPKFWLGDVADLPQRWEKLRRAEVKVIAESPGGRPIHLIAFGEREKLEQKANFNSAIGGRDASCYMDKPSRKKPVVYFVGPVHGPEVEGLTGLASLIQVMETGRDLRGAEQAELRQLGDRCRILIVPAGNPDGTARFEPRAVAGLPTEEFQFWAMGTWSDNTIAVWPTSKRKHPRTGPSIGYMGCYFNDAGINPMHDEFFAPMSAEAPAILRVAMLEGPDLAVSLHSHSSSPAVLRPAYLPLEVQEDVRLLAEEYNAAMEKKQLPHGGLFTPTIEKGERPAPFNLTSALYHISGATAFTSECPHGVEGEKACHVSLDQILDVQLTLYETMLRHALAKKES